MKLKKVLLAVVVATATGVGLASPAQALNTGYENQMSPNACQSPAGSDFDFTYYYNSNLKNAYRNIGYNVWNLGDERIGGAPQGGTQPLRYCVSTGSGAGQDVKNNAASAANRHKKYNANSHFNSGYAGPKDRLAPGNSVNRLTNTYNDNASFSWS
jgi:hypothetical protein